MSSRLQLDMRNLSLGRRHLVNAYEVEAGIGVIAGNTVWSMLERLECEVLQKARYINTLTFYLYLYRRWDIWNRTGILKNRKLNRPTRLEVPCHINVWRVKQNEKSENINVPVHENTKETELC